MDLLPEIKKQLKRQSTPSTRMVFTLTRATTVFVLLLAVSAVLGYAYYQNMLIPPTIPQDLITELNLEQTIDDMTVILHWAYADEHHMAVEISTIHDATITAIGSQQEVSLYTADGILIPPDFGGGGGGGSDPVDSSIIYTSFSSSYNMTAIETTSNTINLILTLNYGYGDITTTDQYSPASGASGGSGGRGGSNGENSNADLVPDSEAPDREFVFEFSLPLLPTRSGVVSQPTIVSDENSVTIQNVQITPSMTIFDLCSPLLSDGWLPDVILETNEPLPDYLQNEPRATSLDGDIVYPAYTDNSPFEDVDCIEMTAPAPFSAGSGELTITVDKFFRSIRGDVMEAINADIDYFAGLDFEVDYEIVNPPIVNQGSGALPLSTGEWLVFTVVSYPDKITQSVAISYIGSNFLKERITGDWAFTVAVE